ncbi:MAG: hypothetical protein PSU94_17480 [Lacunisphaera sp.]|nr:hypothetical protein [Lacunisphaera sp.]
MKLKWFLSVVFLLLAAASGYMAWLTARAEEEGGQWLFVVFAGFFLLLASLPFWPKVPPKAPPPPKFTGFGPHWMLMLGALVLAAVIILAIISALRSWLG